MPSTPYAKLLVSLNGGGPQSGGITAANGDTVQLTAESTAQWDLDTPPRWVIYAYPPGWTGPASGWTTESVPSPFGGTSDIYVYTGLGPPPAFTLPDLPMWGKFLFDLTVQGGLLNGQRTTQLIDRSTAIQIIGPGGLLDIAVGEENQFDPSRAWSGAFQDDLRIIDALLASNTALAARVAALEAMLSDGTATITVGRVQTNFVSPRSSMLKIQARNAPSGSWIEGLTIDSNLLLGTPVTRVAWFGATTVARQAIPNVSTLANTETALINYGLYTRLP